MERYKRKYETQYGPKGFDQDMVYQELKDYDKNITKDNPTVEIIYKIVYNVIHLKKGANNTWMEIIDNYNLNDKQKDYVKNMLRKVYALKIN